MPKTMQKEMKLIKLFEKFSIDPHTMFPNNIYLSELLNNKCFKIHSYLVLNNTFKNLILINVTFY